MPHILDQFNPDLTPEEMEALGILAGTPYFPQADPKSHNYFGIRASMQKWPEKWVHEDAPLGWYDWYKNYYSKGVPHPDDERQIKRWKSFKQRHLGQLSKADPGLQDLSVQPRRRQALLHWAVNPGIPREEILRRVEAKKKSGG